jgi:hypothetical protein
MVSSEGAAGNRYGTSTLATSFAGSRYEIVLFVHSANPDCYPLGTVAMFDSIVIERLFETMVGTFHFTVRSRDSWIE